VTEPVQHHDSSAAVARQSGPCRHLSSSILAPEQYRERYSLKPDYSMVAENYSQARRDMAKKIGLGRKPRAGAEDRTASAPAAEAPAPKRRRKAAPAA
jgi:hypothetical protein